MKKYLRKIGIIALCTGCVIAALLFYAPYYLTYAEEPGKSDAVVLFLGKDLKARLAEANRLLTTSYARYLIVPSYGIAQ